MSSERAALPDYDLEDLRVVGSDEEIKSLFHPLRSTLLDLLLERAATVAELAHAVGRPRSTVAYHVDVLLAAGLLRVVRTRRVRAVEERFYGRTARVFSVGEPTLAPEQVTLMGNALVAAAAESAPAHEADRLRAIRRHARIPQDVAAAFWDRVLELVREFSATPRGGGTTYAFVAGLYPGDHPSLPDPDDPDRPLPG